MDEKHAIDIVSLMDTLPIRLQFDVKNQPPQHLPSIAQTIGYLYQLKNGESGNDQKLMMEIQLLKNINNQVKGFKGE